MTIFVHTHLALDKLARKDLQDLHIDLLGIEYLPMLE